MQVKKGKWLHKLLSLQRITKTETLGTTETERRTTMTAVSDPRPRRYALCVMWFLFALFALFLFLFRIRLIAGVLVCVLCWRIAAAPYAAAAVPGTRLRIGISLRLRLWLWLRLRVADSIRV